MNKARMGHSELTALNNPQTELVILGLSENAGNRNLEVPPAVVLVLDVHASSLRFNGGQCRALGQQPQTLVTAASRAVIDFALRA